MFVEPVSSHVVEYTLYKAHLTEQ